MYGILNDSGSLIARFTVPLTVKSNQPVLLSDTLSLKRFATRSTAQRWEIETGVEPLLDSQELMVNLVTKGFTEGVKVRVPQNYGSVRNTTALPTQTLRTSAQFLPNTQQIRLEGFTNKITAGTFIKFANHNKLYMITSDINSTSTSSEIITNIFPELKITVPTNTVVYFRNDVDVYFLYDTDVVSGMVYEDGILMSPGTIRLVEQL